MSARLEMRCKKSAQGGTTVTFVPDTAEAQAECNPTHLAFTQIVATFAATPAEMFGSATTDGRKYRVTIEQFT